MIDIMTAKTQKHGIVVRIAIMVDYDHGRDPNKNSEIEYFL